MDVVELNQMAPDAPTKHIVDISRLRARCESWSLRVDDWMHLFSFLFNRRQRSATRALAQRACRSSVVSPTISGEQRSHEEPASGRKVTAHAGG